MMAAAAQRPPQTENIIKQGYLKKSVHSSELIPSTSKQLANNIKQKLEPNRWYVFGVRNRQPYLEYFDKEESIFTGQALHTYDLSSFQNLSYTMGRTNTNFTFCIFLAGSFIDLTAPSRAHMVDWCRCLERHLRNLGIRSKNLKEDHQYTAFPVKKIPRPPASDPPEDPPDSSEQNIMDIFLAENADLDSEDEDHDYQDATELLRDHNDDSKDSNDATLPIRPPPRIPKRLNPQDEDVFADLSTVRREEMYSNLEDHRSDVTDAEKHMFGAGSDSESDADDDVHGDKDMPNDGNGLLNACFEDDPNDRCTSLPDIQTFTQESDTSEDSDFMSASFWLRNRRPDAEDNAQSPEVPLRSAAQKPRPQPRNCVSMNMNMMAMNKEGLYDHPLRKVSNHAPVSRKKSDEGTLVVVDQQVKCDNGNTVVLLDDDSEDSDDSVTDFKHLVRRVGTSSGTDLKKAGTSSGTDLKKAGTSSGTDLKKAGASGGTDNKMFDSIDDEYETLTKKPFHDLEKGNKGFNNEKCDKTNPGSDKQLDEVYEAAWMCRTARNTSLSDDDDDCCKKELVVDLPKGDMCNTKTCDQGKGKQSNHSNQKPGSSVRENGAKQKGVFSRLSKKLSKSSKNKELPERLVVELPPESSQRNVSSCTNGDTEQPGCNIYSDLPGVGEEPDLDSDIRKLALLENGPSVDDDSIELPPRHLPDNPKFKSVVTVTSGARPKENFFSKSVGDSSQCFNQDAYEPIDVSKAADAHKNRPPVPIPEKSQSRSLIDFETTGTCYDEAPVAPPRRKKSDKDGSNPELPKRPIPRMRQSMYASPVSGNQEPAVPPRTHLPNKPALPPPPRPASIARATSDVSGVRPKNAILASRQQSQSQPSAVHVMNLKQNQVDILRTEIESTGGLVKLISKVHFQNGLAFVECFGKIWIAGWDVKRFPKLYDKFHIGDELVSINDVQVSDLSFANKLVKNVKAESVEITIRRLPNARVFAIQRSGEGESLGIMREGGTSEILYVDPSGLAAKHGLPSKAVTLDGNGRCNWCLTEINMRALNLFFKESEIEHRLLAVGRDISIVVQPVDFIKELKKQLKKHRSHKDYIIH